MKEIDPSQAQLMERCVERGNMLRAWKRVKKNGGSAGVDERGIEETEEHLRNHWPKIREALLRGSYQPRAVRKVEIEKSGGGIRQLGIPTVTDRLIQQCLLQILQPEWDSTFHPNSYGFRPERSAHQAICQAQRFIQEGRKWVVDVDLEKFFDRVNHDVLMDRVMKRVEDQRVVKLIRRYLKAGIMDHGVASERHEGTPQGGPLSPLLANLLLNEVDWELEKRGLAFCRYADDCNIYVKSKRAAEDAMQTLEKLMSRLRLTINREKSAIARAWERKFLGYRFWNGIGKVTRRAVSKQAIAKFKQQIRTLTRRSCGRGMAQVVKRLDGYLLGWKGYFQLAETPRVFEDLDGWIRSRLRSIHLKQWKTSQAQYRELTGRGLSSKAAESISGAPRCYWRMAQTSGVKIALPNSYFDALGLTRLAA